MRTYLQDVDTLPCDEAVNLIFVVKVSSEHFGRLVHGMFNLYRNTATGL